jgi:hypothetical protein
MNRSKIIIGSLTHNDETKGWLENWFKTNVKYADKFVILDDCSTDNTFKYLTEQKTQHDNLFLYTTHEPTFAQNENEIRSILWEKIKLHAEEGDWVLILDSDELLQETFNMIRNNMSEDCLLVFKKIELWEESKYRVDNLWSNYFERMFPFRNEYFGWEGKGFHHPQIPKYATMLKRNNTLIPITHISYQTKELRNKKFDFMIRNDQQLQDISYYNFMTIKDESKKKLKLTNDYMFQNIDNIILDLDNTFEIQEELYEFLRFKSFHAIVRPNTNYKCIEQLESLKDSTIHYFYKDLGILFPLEEKLDKEPNTLFIIAAREFNELDFFQICSTDKEIVMNERMSLCLINNDYVNFARKFKLKTLDEIIKLFEPREYIWLVGDNIIPFPFNCEKILQRFKNNKY